MKKALTALAIPVMAASISTTAIAAATASSALNARHTSLGKTLVDGRGRTLYIFKRDRANMSNCSSACLSVWPAMTASSRPKAIGGVVSAKTGTIRTRGVRQVTYAGHPLYYYVGDRKPGDVNGQGLDQFGGKWYALLPSGRVIDND